MKKGKYIIALLGLVGIFLQPAPVYAVNTCYPSGNAGKYVCDPAPSDPRCTSVDLNTALCDAIPTGYTAATDNGDGTSSAPKVCRAGTSSGEFICSPVPPGCSPLSISSQEGICNSVPNGYTNTTPSTPTQTLTTTQKTNGTLQYSPLEPLPGLGNVGNITFAQMLQAVFNILLTGGALLAVVTLVWGGIMYMVSEAGVEKGQAKSRMQAAIFGLLLLSGSWLILHTINPRLLIFNLSIDGQDANTGNRGAGSSNPRGTNVGSTGTNGQNVGSGGNGSASNGGNVSGSCPKGVCAEVSGGAGISVYDSLTAAERNKAFEKKIASCKQRGYVFAPTPEKGVDGTGSYTVWSCRHPDGTFDYKL